jgi:crotonobetainyl-CoA:carnitine CoA-transferase CaiB-like acyl-CoA transferase
MPGRRRLEDQPQLNCFQKIGTLERAMDIKQHNIGAVTALGQLIEPLGLTLDDVGGSVTIFGFDPLFSSAVRLGEAFSIAAMAAAVGAAAIWRARTGQGQSLSIDIRQAAHGINPEYTFHPTINGHPYPNWMGNAHPFTIFPYKTKDGRWVYPSGVYPHQHDAWSNFFHCGISHRDIASSIAKWNADELEDVANSKGHTLCVARWPEEWLAHPQGIYLSQEPVIAVKKIGESKPEPFLPADRPLQNIKVLSLTHAVAGPVVGRTLAEQGADVLSVNHHDDFEHDWVYDDANAGHRSTFLDFEDSRDNETCRDLARGADVVVENFRGRKMARYGFSPEELARLRPGTIVVSVRCYGWGGPWFDRGGFDMLGTAASGLAMLEGANGMPAMPPTGLINDYVTGYMGAAGAAAALLKRARQGGSYHVTVSLARCAMWYQSLGLVPEGERAFAKNHNQQIWNLSQKDLPTIMQDLRSRLLEPASLVRDTPLGKLRRLAPAVTCSATPARWDDPILVPRGSSAPEWRMTE